MRTVPSKRPQTPEIRVLFRRFRRRTRRPCPRKARVVGKDGGAKRNRTADLLLAGQALSQLSYGPMPFLARLR